MKIIDKLLSRIEEIITLTGLAVMVILNFLNVVVRFLMPSISFAFTEEVTNILFVWVSLFGACAAFKEGAHLGLPLIYDHLNNKGKIAMSVFAMLVELFCLGIFTKYSISLTISQIENHVVSTAMGIPMAYGYLSLPVAGIIMCIRVIQHEVISVKGLCAEKEVG